MVLNFVKNLASWPFLPFVMCVLLRFCKKSPNHGWAQKYIRTTSPLVEKSILKLKERLREFAHFILEKIL
jgi:hypothetical protein